MTRPQPSPPPLAWVPAQSWEAYSVASSQRGWPSVGPAGSSATAGAHRRPWRECSRLWRSVQPSIWVVDVVLNEVFGEGGDLYSGLAVFLVAIPLFRLISGFAGGLVSRLVARQGEDRASSV